MNFNNAASNLPNASSPELKAWKHEMLCILIRQGVVNPNELIETTEKLYKYIVETKA